MFLIFRASSRCAASLVLLLWLSIDALACSCGRPTVDRFLEYTVTIFTGVAQGSEPAERGRAITTFRVTRGYKGAKRGEIIRIHHRTFRPGNCGKTFESGKTYTVPASRARDGTTLTTNSCSFWIMGRHWKVLKERLQR
jgi:hypothetical protein